MENNSRGKRKTVLALFGICMILVSMLGVALFALWTQNLANQIDALKQKVTTLQQDSNSTAGDYSGYSRPKFEAGVYMVFQMHNGTYEYYVPDLITTIGEQYDAELILGNASVIDGGTGLTNLNATCFSYGNATIAVGLTQLTQEATNSGFGRGAANSTAQWLNGGHYATNFTRTVTCTAAITLNAVGIQWSLAPSTDLNLYAAFALPQSTTFEVSDNLTTTWIRTANSAGN